MFTKPRTSLCGPFPATVSIPKVAQDGTSDYEAELAVILSKDCRNVSEESALDFVLGYTAANDVSARNLQMEDQQWSFSKGLDGACVLGNSFEVTSTANVMLKSYMIRSRPSLTGGNTKSTRLECASYIQ